MLLKKQFNERVKINQRKALAGNINEYTIDKNNE